MASVTVSTSGTQSGGSRVVVRTSAGIPYVVVDTGNDIDIYKGNSTTPTSFSNTGTGPSASTYGYCAVAIDSSDIIHIAYYSVDGKNSALRYVTFVTSTDSFSGDTSIQDIGGASPTNPGVAIAVDSNDIPHVAWVDSKANKGTDYDTIYYTNRVGGSWNTAVEIEGGSASKNCRYPSITIESQNLPVVSYTNSTDSDWAVAIGNVNNATSFTLQDIFASGDTTDNSSVCVDGNGRVYVAFSRTNGSYVLNYHTLGDSWATWTTGLSGTGQGTTVAAQAVSLFANGTDIYVFQTDSASDVGYDVYDGS